MRRPPTVSMATMNVLQTPHLGVLVITCCVLSSWIIACSEANSLKESKGDEIITSVFDQAKPQSRSILQQKHLSYLTLKKRGPVLISRWRRQTGTNRKGSKQHKKPRKKSKRSVETSSGVDSYEGFHINLTTCGVEKSCVRIGPDNCGHRECLYILTFKKIGDSVQLELSANTQGWVAVGFSSDRKMGADDVIACVHNLFPSKIRASAKLNPYSHQKPQDTNIPVNLTAAEYKDGFVSCRVQRYIAPDGAMDLTNDWYQLYAWGTVVSNGIMMRHDLEKPPTSVQSYSILRRDINVVRLVASGGHGRYGQIGLMAMLLSTSVLLLI